MSTRLVARRDSSSQHGIALISTILVIMIITLLSVVAVSLSEHALNTTAVDRKRTQSISAAEAGIDLTLQTMTGTSLPCSAASSLGTGPTQSSYSVTVNYYDSSGNALSCTPSSGPVGTPATAELTSTGTTNANTYGTRVMQALVKITASVSGGFDKAIFAQTSLSFSNKTTVQGNGANNAELYTNGSYTCTNNQMIYGDVYSQGDITASNTCSVSGDWWAKGNVSASGNGSVGGNVYAAGATTGSAGTIGMGNTSVADNAVAKGSISPTPCGPGHKIAGTCSANTNPGAPPQEAFPVLAWNASAWTGAGYTVVDDRGQCTKLYTDLAAMATATTPTVFITDCQVDWGKNTWTFNTNVAVWSSAGMDTSNKATITSASAATHNFYMIVPYYQFGTTTPVTCGSFPDGAGNIAFKNNTTIGTTTAPINNFVYTPCGISFTNNQTNVGQLYAGAQVTVTNNFTMDFQLVPVPGGALSGGNVSTTGYNVALEYKREG